MIALPVLLGLWIFAVGAVVGSFANVCIYRIPWQKSVVWPASHCPHCLRPIAARDNIPVLSWFILRGECRRCAQPISPRYALIEALVGLLFVAVFVSDVVFAPVGVLNTDTFGRMAYHQVLVAALVVATFIDYDLQIIPDEITVPGMAFGVLIGFLAPGIRPDPSTATTHLDGLWVGLKGLLIGGGLTWSFRFVFSRIFRREAMGQGDITLMGMIGAFLGWQSALLAFFLAPFFGFAPAIWKGARFLWKLVTRRQLSSSDRELAFGPYLSMAAVSLLLLWEPLWRHWGAVFFATLAAAIRFLATGQL
jgi:leader peptidase (prepilin peptidase)/N-methyltransferase